MRFAESVPLDFSVVEIMLSLSLPTLSHHLPLTPYRIYQLCSWGLGPQGKKSRRELVTF